MLLLSNIRIKYIDNILFIFLFSILLYLPWFWYSIVCWWKDLLEFQTEYQSLECQKVLIRCITRNDGFSRLCPSSNRNLIYGKITYLFFYSPLLLHSSTILPFPPTDLLCVFVFSCLSSDRLFAPPPDAGFEKNQMNK